ncbi:NAD-binding protein [Tetragenococcus muriaticus]|uniref:mannitol dehydrogenase family protein n=2 Tax=Tetragenococcus muriaticus TaxID=64642 RepID=UPI00040505AB|nr:NAD-binding protein [Tetragenococcus muriaticus]GMA47482.1 mannitol-1-phosphate 5-dehydrogenase [Tetragenococcus muriaticus]
MHATIIGGGRIGRGFVASLLKRNHVEITFFDTDQELVKNFEQHSSYTVHVLGNEKENTIINEYKINHINNSQAWADELTKTDIIFTAVGGKNLTSLGKIIGKNYQQALAREDVPSFILVTCENWMTPAEDLQQAIETQLADAEKYIFQRHVDITQAVIRASGTSAPNGEETINPLDTWVQDYWVLPVDGKRLQNHQKPNLQYFEFRDDFGEMLAQKIYTNNTSVALIAYLGYLKGINYVADAANDSDIEPILEMGYEEINQALIYSLGVSEESQLEFSRVAEAKYKDYSIVDEVIRIGRDPIRKLASDDRLIGPANMAMDAGVNPKAISLATAAAIYFDYPKDPSSVELKRIRETQGIDAVLEEVCGISKESTLANLIKESISELKEHQWIKGEA